jgi:hypothetical protein
MATGYWNKAFIDEVCSFPNGTHDDQLDALSGAWSMLDPDVGVGGLNVAEPETYGIGVY